MHFKGKINQFEWEMATITVSDYSVEHDIDTRAYKKWRDDHYTG